MKFAGHSLEDVVAALKRRGFTYQRRTPKNWLQFSGQLTAAGSRHEVELKLSPTLDLIPSIRLLSRAYDPRLLPHLSPDGGLCYIAQGSYIFDWFNAPAQTIACVDRAEKILDDVLSDRLTEDLVDEFFVHWEPTRHCIYDFDQHRFNLGQVMAYAHGNGEDAIAYITDDKERALKKCSILGWKRPEQQISLVSVKSRARPIPDQTTWPPNSVSSVLIWLCKLDNRCARAVDNLLLKAYKSKSPMALVVIESPGVPYAFIVNFVRATNRSKLKTYRPALYQLPIHRAKVHRLDEHYMATRNLPGEKSLAGRKISLVGCGTVGGYLAEMLVKAGAGTSGGLLTLIDNDTLGPQNIGRHRLGFSSLFKKKAEQLKVELQRGHPSAMIEVIIEDARSVSFDDTELIIDATGEQALTEWLTWKLSNTVPILACWVEGAGLAVRGILKAELDHACSRCISSNPKSNAFRIFVDTPEMVLKGHGCEDLYVPFPASASVQAAALAMEMTQSWSDKVDGPTLRTRVLNSNLSVHFTDGTPPRMEGCPACSF